MKWGEYHKPINHFTRGYVAAVFGALFERPARSYKVTELQGMVTGEQQSVFTVEAA
jgi:predicted hydrocarbon binding protein